MGRSRQKQPCPWQRSSVSSDDESTSAGNNVPNTEEMDCHGATERHLEMETLLIAPLGILLVHLVRERDLLVVPCGKQAHLVEHAGQSSCSVCAAGEAKQADLVAFLV